MNPSVYRVQKRGGKGVIGATTREGDAIAQVTSITTHDNLMFFTDTGKVFQTKAYEIPESSRTSKGQAIVNFLQLAQGEKITAMIAINAKEDGFKYLFMTTAKGTIKKTKISDFDNVRRSGLIAITLEKGDTLGWVKPSTGSDQVVITTSDGQAIRFKESDVRAMGRGAAGVRGIKLHSADGVVGMDVIADAKDSQLLILTENGFGKRSEVKHYKIQKRGGSGIRTVKLTPKTGKLVGALVLRKGEEEETDLIATSQKGTIIRVPLKSVPSLSRVTQGVRVMRPQSGDRVGSFTIL